MKPARHHRTDTPPTDAPERSGPTRAVPELPSLPEELPSPLNGLVQRCPVAGRLFMKARLREDLGPAEVHVAVQTFSHLGEEGRRFVHQLLAHLPSYDPDEVNRALARVPPLPIGCDRARKRLRAEGAPDLCVCVFRLPPDSYATPLAHIDIFPRVDSAGSSSRAAPPDLDRDGRSWGYLSRRAKAAARLQRLRRKAGRRSRR